MFYSILFATPVDREVAQQPTPPACLSDLNLDQIIDAITELRPQYNLTPFFYQPLSSIAAINYRHAIMQELENRQLYQIIETFLRQFNELQGQLKQTAHFGLYNRAGCFLDIIELYCNSVSELSERLNELLIHASGFIEFRQYLTEYLNSNDFKMLQTGLQHLRTSFEQVKYSLHIKGRTIKVSRVVQGESYNNLLKSLLARFSDGTAGSYCVDITGNGVELNQVENKILVLVSKLYPAIFTELEHYYQQYHQNFLNQSIVGFSREIQFYLAYLDYTAKLQQDGLAFCYPQLVNNNNIHCYNSFDLALAHKLVKLNTPVVCNDFYLREQESIFIISGPNQGGKTTFARMFGQLHFLASLGCKVPGSAAQLLRTNKIFTHFEREEQVKNLRGKLKDELIRIEQILAQVGTNDIIIMNEMFNSTTLVDAKLLSRKIIEQISRLNILAVCVTFIDELATLNCRTVSMVSAVTTENPAIRSYKITRQPITKQLYAHTLADNYQLSYEQLKIRIK